MLCTITILVNIGRSDEENSKQREHWEQGTIATTICNA